ALLRYPGEYRRRRQRRRREYREIARRRVSGHDSAHIYRAGRIQLDAASANWNRKQHIRACRIELGEIARVIVRRGDGERILRSEKRTGEVRVTRGVDRQACVRGGSSRTCRIIEARRVNQL